MAQVLKPSKIAGLDLAAFGHHGWSLTLNRSNVQRILESAAPDAPDTRASTQLLGRDIEGAFGAPCG